MVVSRPASGQLPVEVACLAHLERCVEIAGSSIVVVAFYSRVSIVGLSSFEKTEDGCDS